MKRLFFITWFVFLTILIACGGGNSKTDKSNNNSIGSKRTISGIAAIGAVIEEGAVVQVKPAAIEGIPSDIIEGRVLANGNYEIVIPEEIPVDNPIEDPITESTSSKSILKSTTPENGTGFLIRVWSASVGSWIYSYSPNNSAEMTANVNPYTDMMMRRFYATANNIAYPLNNANDQDINIIFVNGYFHDGVTPVNVPTPEIITKVMNLMSNMLYRIYGLSDIQNALADSWQVDLGLDALLNTAGRPRLNEILQYGFTNLFFDPDVITDGYAIQNNVGDPIIVEFWTPYGNTGNVALQYNNGTGGGLQIGTLIKQSDSIEGSNHFKGSVAVGGTGQASYPSVYITIDDYNNGIGFGFVIKRP